MALIKKEALEKFEVVNANTIPMIQCRHSIWVEDDATGEKFGSPQYHRHVITPTDDVSQESAQIQALAAALFTPEVKAAYEAQLAEQAQ